MSAFLLWAPGSTDSTATATLSSSLSFDVVTNENPQFPNTIASHVVEEGFDVTDNVRVGAKTLTLEVFVTNEPTAGPGGSVQNAGPINTPDASWPSNKNPSVTYPVWFSLPVGIPLAGPLLAATGLSNQTSTFTAAAGGDPTKGVQINPTVMQYSTPTDPVQITHDALDTLRSTKQLVEVVGTKGVYDNMIITHFDMTRGADEGTGGTFTIELQEVRIVSTEIVNAPVPTKPRGQKNKPKGSSSTTSIGPSSPSSLLAQAKQGLQQFAALFSGQTTPPLGP